MLLLATFVSAFALATTLDRNPFITFVGLTVVYGFLYAASSVQNGSNIVIRGF